MVEAGKFWWEIYFLEELGFQKVYLVKWYSPHDFSLCRKTSEAIAHAVTPWHSYSYALIQYSIVRISMHGL